jgi:alpha-maltose-1-phosphate synthase
MKALILYPYPLEPDGLSIQGHYISKGLEELGIDVRSLDRSDNKEKKRIYKEFKPDVVIGVGFWGNTPDLIHHPQKNNILPIPWLNANGWIANYHKTLDELPLLIATSNWVKSTYIRDGLNGKNIQICPIGFDPIIYHPISKENIKTKKVRSNLGIKDDELMILTAGGDVTSKGAQEMISALAKINGKFSKWKYVLKTYPSFSADNHGKEEANLIESLGINKNKFIYLKAEYTQEKMATLLQACDIYAAPSRLEGFGMIQVEAMACGKPVISINVGGPKDTIIHNKTGFLVDVEHEVKLDKEWVYPSMGFKKKMMIEFPRPKTFAYRANTDQLAHYTLQLMQSSKLREKIGKAGAEHALKNYHYQIVAKRMLDLIQKHILHKQ